MLALGLLLGTLSFRKELKDGRQAHEREQAALILSLGTSTAGLLENQLQRDDAVEAEITLNLIRTMDTVAVAFLCDPSNRVVWGPGRGRALAETSHRAARGLVEQVRQARAGRVEIDGEGARVVGAFPIRRPPAAGELRSFLFDVLVLESELTPLHARNRADALRRSSASLLALAAVCLGMWGIFSALVTRRVGALTRAARRVAAGEPEVRSSLRGGDELVELSEAFDDMAVRVRHRRQELLAANEALRHEMAERRRAEAELASRERELAQVVETVTVGLVYTNAQGRITFANPAAGAVLRRPPADLVGRSFGPPDLPFLAAGGDPLDAAAGPLSIALVGRGSAEYALALPDGQRRVLAIQAGRVQDPRGERHGVVFSLEDVSERIEGEARRLQLEEQLRQSQRLEAVGALAGGIAHDFNNLLAAMGLNADLLAADLPQGSRGFDRLEAVREALRRARDLVRQILTFSRRNERRRGVLHLPLVVREATGLLRPTLPTSIELVVHVSEDVPPSWATPRSSTR